MRFSSGCFFLTSGLRVPENAVTVTGEITDIVSQRTASRKSQTTHLVFVDYEFESKTYRNVQLDIYTIGMKEGKEIELTIDPKDPENPFVPGSNMLLGIFLSILGLGVSYAGISSLVITIKKETKTKKLLQQGHYVIGKAAYVDLNHKYAENRVHPYILHCYYQDDNGTIHNFKSGNYWKNLNDYFQQDSPIRIYVDGHDYKNYFVDVDGSIQNNSNIVDYT